MILTIEQWKPFELALIKIVQKQNNYNRTIKWAYYCDPVNMTNYDFYCLICNNVIIINNEFEENSNVKSREHGLSHLKERNLIALI